MALTTLRRNEDRQMKLEKHQHILDWLSPIDPEINYKRALSLTQQGTCEWLLHKPQFQSWLAEESDFLWIHGVPGSGKTVLSSSIIAKLESLNVKADEGPSLTIAYHFLDFKDGRSLDPTTVFGTLIKELYFHLSTLEMHPSIQSLYDLSFDKTSGKAEKPSWKDLVELLAEIAVLFPRVLLVIDALDEAPQEAQEKVLCPSLKQIASQEGSRVATLITSRNEIIIEQSFGELSNIHLEVDCMSPDIARYVKSEVRRRPGLAALENETQEQVVQRVCKGAHGMFRWASCQLDALSELQDAEQISQALKTLPKGLHQTYDRILGKVHQDDTKRVRRCLTWLANSDRPLTPAELIEAISVDPGDKNPVRNKAPMTIQRLLRMCGGLMIEMQVKETPLVGLAHASVKEYLQSPDNSSPCKTYKITLQRANQELAHTCLTYLAFDAFKRGPVDEYIDFENRLKEFPLLEYAAKYTPVHFRSGKMDLAGRWPQALFPTTNRKDRINTSLKSWRQVRDGFGQHEPFMIQDDMEATPLFFASESGLTSIVKQLLAFGVDVNINSFYGTALQAASSEGHLDVVEGLLGHGADLNATSEELGNALQAACAGGHALVAKTLVGKAADLNQISGFYGTALEAAAYRGKAEIVELLLSSGSAVNLLAGRYGTALIAASYRGRVGIVQHLLESGADVNVQGTRYGNALKAASEEGHLKVVKILLDAGADISIIGAEYGTALQSASRSGSEAVLQVLLDAGAAIDAVGGYYGTALQAAARTNIEVTKALLNAGADVNQEAGHYNSALSAAIYFGKTDIVEILLDRGALADATSVQSAIVRGHQTTASLLEKRLGPSG